MYLKMTFHFSDGEFHYKNRILNGAGGWMPNTFMLSNKSTTEVKRQRNSDGHHSPLIEM